MSAAGVQEQIWCIKSSAAACRSKFGASNHLLQECRSKFGASNHLPQECRSKFGASNHLPQRAGANLVHQIICRSVQEQILCFRNAAAGARVAGGYKLIALALGILWIRRCFESDVYVLLCG